MEMGYTNKVQVLVTKKNRLIYVEDNCIFLRPSQKTWTLA